ncbi:transcriptional regulator, BadM/Rrf2 family [Thermoactinomyces sp. DSM 45891]|uniref:RrF2 family transcriptional regulator n=1 Tax=Thermoactinomyces sp. DSM 45891 TaxID=1761907 RepID=UPI00091DF3F8|nr:Rrf2 family transcriptional regulator [Thermoactinomyces sp. DSM 45891]SFX21212.1 transcriptional regulator, BadM/Rrf2 family [Thermoactinomyces sp. DSM 45891]
MKVSSRGEYALRALIALGLQEGNVSTIADISGQTLVPAAYLEQILLQLKMLGYLKSRRGKKGGYMLAKAPDQIVIGEVIRSLEGPLAPMGCVSITSYEACPLEGTCLLKPFWALIRDSIAQLLDQTTLAHLIERKL